MHANEDIFNHGHAAKQANVLEGAGYPQRGNLVGAMPYQAAAVEKDMAFLGPVNAGEGVEEGGFPCAVWANDTDHLARSR